MKRTNSCIYGFTMSGKLPCESGMECPAHSSPHACHAFVTERKKRRKSLVTRGWYFDNGDKS